MSPPTPKNLIVRPVSGTLNAVLIRLKLASLPLHWCIALSTDKSLGLCHLKRYIFILAILYY